MGRQLSIESHCLLCLKAIHTQAYGHGNAKQLYERIHNQGFSGVAQLCNECLGYVRGGNWPTDVYRKLTEGREPEGQRAVEALVAA